MREIKFRAWDNVHKCFNSTVAANLLLQIHEESEDLTEEYGKRFFLSQFTGFKDEYKNEIFESDILEYGIYRYLVVFENGCFYLYHYEGLKETHGGRLRWGPMLRIPELSIQMKIVGNLYEGVTPKLRQPDR